MKINDRNISKNFEPYIIAELSANHGGSVERAKKSIYAAAKTGVSAVKIQTYQPTTMTIKCNKPDFLITKGLWAGKQLFDLYEEAHTPYEWHRELFDFANKIGITIFSTPFDESAVDLLEELNTPAYKIASFEINDIPLIKYIAKKNKPIFLSTGMASLDEIEEAVSTIRNNSESGILLFHCISGYPVPTKESHLNNILHLKNRFKLEVGLSDHTNNNIAAITAIGMGAVAIEKHFKLDDLECGPDSSFSLNIPQLEDLVAQCIEAWQAKGSSKFSRSQIEEDNTLFRRSLYYVKNLCKGHVLTKSDIRRIRPGFGISPKNFEKIIGCRIIKDVEEGDPVSWKDF